MADGAEMGDPTEIRAGREGDALVIRFARPEARNALTDTMLAETRAAMQAVALDRDVAAVILTGDDKAFCAGGDLKGTAAGRLPPYDRYLVRYTQSVWHEFMRFLANYPRPVIAAIEGYALGGGLELALRCDFAVGSTSVRLGAPEARHGLFPILGGAWSLAQAVGEPMAKELLFTARRLDGEEARSLGLINHLVAEGQALAKALEIASQIAENGPLAVVAAKQAVNRARGQTFEEALNAGGDLSALLSFSEDRKEGLAAFTEKRKAKFTGN